MLSSKTRTAFIVALAALAAVSCKDDDETTSYSYIDGTLTISGLETFIEHGCGEITMTASGASHPTGGTLSYSWSKTPTSDDEEISCTSTEFTYNFDNTVDLGTYSFTCSASAEGYYGLSATATTVVVQSGFGTGCSLSGIDIMGLGYITDSRTDAAGNSGKNYYYTRIGDLDWFVNNLAYETAASSEGAPTCLPYWNADAMTDIFGLYYSYEAASTACPEGWRLPTLEEWESCIEKDGVISGDLMVNARFNGTRMWEYWPKVNITNSLGLNVLPTGYANLDAGSFHNAFDVRYSSNSTLTMAMFWVNDSANSGSGKATYKYIIEDQPETEGESGIYTYSASDSSFGASVRCVRNAQ